MKVLILLCSLILITACQKQADSRQAAGSGGFNVEKLFTVENCSVYRFWDGRTVYYTNCSGSTQVRESCGKNCSYDRQVSGGVQ